MIDGTTSSSHTDTEVPPPPPPPPQRNRNSISGSSSSSSSTTDATTNKRMGTIPSATLNIWSTMVGGGALSLPLAFAKTGNGLFGPLLLIVTARLTQFCFGILLDAILYNTNTNSSITGSSSAAATTTTTRDVEGVETMVPSPPLPDQPQQQQRPQLQYKSHHTLENITAAAAAAVTVSTNRTDDRTTTTLTSVDADHHTHRLQEQQQQHQRRQLTAYTMSAILILLMCFFGIIGYCVLLRDMLLPLTQSLWKSTSQPSSMGTVIVQQNAFMIVVVMVVTPLCTLPTLTSLQKFSTLSMCAILILGSCIVYRSIQCQLGYYHPSSSSSSNSTNTTNTTTINGAASLLTANTYPYIDSTTDEQQQNEDTNGNGGFTFFPHSIKDVLDVLPLYISCYVCHYNIPLVYNDFMHPTTTRVRTWLQVTVWGATLFYCIIGIAGSSFAVQCGCKNSVVQGNVLLNFDPDDPLLLVGRLCLAVTIALAFPVLTIPARDILLRCIVSTTTATSTTTTTFSDDNNITTSNDLTEPLLSSSSNENDQEIGIDEDESTVHASNLVVPNTTLNSEVHHQEVPSSSSLSSSWMQRLLVSILVLWTGTGIACCVSSIAIVWDLLGSSLSIVLSYLIPCGCYIVLRRRHDDANNDHNISSSSSSRNGHIATMDETIVRDCTSKWIPSTSSICWIIISVFTPLMFISTGNAIYNLLFDATSPSS